MSNVIHKLETDYGIALVKVEKVDGRNVYVQLIEDFPPLGENGDKSWVINTQLTPTEDRV